MEDSKELYLKLVFVVPGWISLISSIYSFIYWDELISKILMIHIFCVSLFPTLLEFSSLFNEYLFSQGDKTDTCYLKIGVLFYLCITTSVFGIGVLASISSIISLVSALVLILYLFKNQISHYLGFAPKVPSLYEV